MMPRKPEAEAEDRARRDVGRIPERHVLAVGKRVKHRWLVEMSLVAPHAAPPLDLGKGARAA